jgi:hypothetical protein
LIPYANLPSGAGSGIVSTRALPVAGIRRFDHRLPVGKNADT